jgi:hypothetical protein
VSGKYWLYINGTLTSSDTVGARSPQKLDSITGIQSLVKGGGNDISIHVTNVDSTFNGLSVVFVTLLDTTQHFKPSGKYPFKQQAQEEAAPAPLPAQRESPRQKTAPFAQEKKAAPAAGTPPHEKKEAAAPGAPKKKAAPNFLERLFSKGPKDTSEAAKYKTSKDVMNAVVEYQKKTELLASEIKKERLEVQKLRIKNEDLDEQIRKVKEEIVNLKKKPEETGKKK